MESLNFYLPQNELNCQKFRKFIELVQQEKIRIAQAVKSNCIIERCEQIDKYVWDDLVTVIGGLREVPSGESNEWMIWSLHRSHPRWGAPLFSLTADETNDMVYLSLSISDDWTDDEALVETIHFNCIDSFSSFSDKWEKLMSSKGINYWVKSDNKKLEVFLDTINN